MDSSAIEPVLRSSTATEDGEDGPAPLPLIKERGLQSASFGRTQNRAERTKGRAPFAFATPRYTSTHALAPIPRGREAPFGPREDQK